MLNLCCCNDSSLHYWEKALLTLNAPECIIQMRGRPSSSCARDQNVKFNEVNVMKNRGNVIPDLAFVVYSGINTITVFNNKTGASLIEWQFILSSFESEGFIFLNMFSISQN